MIDGGVEILNLPTVSAFLERLSEYAGKNGAAGKWGYYPETKGKILTTEMAEQLPDSKKYVGKQVFDANGLLEDYLGIKLDGTSEKRIQFQYEEWCYGHIGEKIEEMVQLPGAAVFKVNQEGKFVDVGYLYKKIGTDIFDWLIFVCNDAKNGLQIAKMDSSWNRWGLISMVMRYDLKGPMTEKLPPLKPGTPYAIVGSSVLNFRQAPGEKLITSLPNGSIVELTGRIYGDWTEVKVGDITGVVFSKFLEKHPEG